MVGKETRIIDNLLKSGSYLPNPAQEPPKEEHWRSQAEEYRTVVRWLCLYIIILIILGEIGCSSLLELIF